MFHTQITLVVDCAVKCARFARAVVTNRYPTICGIDTGSIIDHLTEYLLYRYSNRNNMVTQMHNQYNVNIEFELSRHTSWVLSVVPNDHQYRN